MTAATVRPETPGRLVPLARRRSASRQRRRCIRKWARTVALAAGLAGPLLIGLLGASTGTAAAAAPPAPAPATLAPTVPAAPAWPSPVPSAPIPVDTDAPSPASPGPAGDPLDPGGGEEDPGFFDVGGKIRKAINDWFRILVTSAASSLLDALGRTVLSTPDPETNPRIRDLWTTAVIIANTCYGLFVVVGGLIGMGYETVQTRTAVKDILPRLVVGFVAANVSLGLVGQAVRFTNALCQAFTGQGVRPGEGATWSKLVIVPVAGDGIFIILLCLVAVVLAAVLIGTCILRAAIIVLLAVSGPLALSCHALPQTEGVANLWWRALAGTLAVQLAQAFTLVTAVRVFLVAEGSDAAGLTASGRLINVLLAICLLWVCIRIPTWVRHMIFSGGGRRSLVGTVVRTLILAKTLGLARSGLSRLGRSGVTGPAAGRGAAGGPGRGPGGGLGGPGGGPRRGPGGGSGPSGPAGPLPRSPRPRGPRGGPGGGPGSRPGGARRPGPRPDSPAGTRSARPGVHPGGARTDTPAAPAPPARPDRPGPRPGDVGWAAPTPARLSPAGSAGGTGSGGRPRAAQRIRRPAISGAAIRQAQTRGMAGTVAHTSSPPSVAGPGRISATGAATGASVQRAPAPSTTPRSTSRPHVGHRHVGPRAEGVRSSPPPPATARAPIPAPARGADPGGPPPAPRRRAAPRPPVDRRAQPNRVGRRAEGPTAAAATASGALRPVARPTRMAPVRPARAADTPAAASTTPFAAPPTVPPAAGHTPTADIASPPPRPPAISRSAAPRPARSRVTAARPALPSLAAGLDPRTGRAAPRPDRRPDRPAGRPDEQRRDQR
jgi:hypothetical protein